MSVTIPEMRQQCDEQADQIFVRDRDALGKLRTMAFSELTDEQKQEWVKTWIARRDKGGVLKTKGGSNE